MKKIRALCMVLFYVVVLCPNAHSDETEKLLSSKRQADYLLSLCVNTGNSHLAFRVDTVNMCLEVGHLTENNNVINITVKSADGTETSKSYRDFAWFMPSEDHALPNFSSDSVFLKKLGLELPDIAVNPEDTGNEIIKNISVADLFKAAGHVDDNDKGNTEEGASAVNRVSANKLLTTLFPDISDCDALTILENSSKYQLQCTLNAVKILDDQGLETGIIDNNRFQIQIKKALLGSALFIDSGAHIIVAANGYSPRIIEGLHGWAYSKNRGSAQMLYKGDTSLHPRDSENHSKSSQFNFDSTCGAAIYAIYVVIGMHQRCASFDIHRYSAGGYIDVSDAGGDNGVIGFCGMDENMEAVVNDHPDINKRIHETVWESKPKYKCNDVRLKNFYKVLKTNSLLKGLTKKILEKRKPDCSVS